jgi:hypothetical protein
LLGGQFLPTISEYFIGEVSFIRRRGYMVVDPDGVMAS